MCRSNNLLTTDDGAEAGSPEWPLPMHRFRPNVVVAGAPAWAEDGWVGGRIGIGEVTFRVPEACGRRVVATTDQETGERGHEPLRVLAVHRNIDGKLLFGVNLVRDAPATSGWADPVEVLGPQVRVASPPRRRQEVPPEGIR